MRLTADLSSCHLYFAGHTESFQIHMVFDDPDRYTYCYL